MLVKSACDQVQVRLLNPSPDNKVVYEGTKTSIVEDIDEIKPHGAVLAVQLKNKGVSPLKQQVLGKMVKKYAGILTINQREQLYKLLQEYHNHYNLGAYLIQVPIHAHPIFSAVIKVPY